MWITSQRGAGYHPNPGVESGHTSSMSRMSWNKVRMMLFDPKVFQVGVGRNGGVGRLGHTGKVTKEEAICKAKSDWDVERLRIQFGC